MAHKWRVSAPEEAELLVIPQLGSFQRSCKGITPITTTIAAIEQTESWRTRPHDHMYVMLDFKNPTSFQPNASVHSQNFIRAYVETRWSQPHIGRYWTRNVSHPPHLLIAAPYVDNGDGDYYGYTVRPTSTPSRSVSGSTHSHRGTIEMHSNRSIHMFFGGRTSSRVGPGRKGQGHYLRWSLMRQWQQHEADRGCAGGSCGGDGGDGDVYGRLLLVDSDQEKQSYFPWASDWPAAPFCNSSTDPCLGPRWRATSNDLTSRPPTYRPTYKPTTLGTCVDPSLSWSAALPCVSSCKAERVNWQWDAMHGVCHGHYATSAVLQRSRFALCLRGDIPTSPRPYDAIRYGAIPVLVSDYVWRVGIPFQCWVPWRLFTLSVSEGAFLRDAAGALQNATASLSPPAEARARELIAHFGRDLLWRHPQSRVAENVLLTARRWASRGNPLRGCCPLEDEIVD